MQTKCGLVLGFYHHPARIRSILRRLRGSGFLRSAVIFGTQDGRHRWLNLRPPTAIIAAISIAAGLISAGLLMRPLLWVEAPRSAYIGAALIAAALAVLPWVLFRLPWFGVDDKLLSGLTSWVLSDETLIVVEAPTSHAARISSILAETAGGEPVLFVLHPGFDQEPKLETELLRREPLALEQLSLRASKLPDTLVPIDRKRPHRRPLQPRLDAADTALKRLRDQLAEAVEVDQSVAGSADWLLDNAYIIQGHIDEFRRNLPSTFYEELPLASSGPLTGFPRIYGLACELVADTDAHLDRENISVFLQSFQSAAPLTIGEIWAVPLMLRLRLIEALHVLSVAVFQRQRESQQASFWANRLLHAARKDPDRMLGLMATLAQSVPHPSPHFADHLVRHLYDEETALTPVRSWMEKRLGSSLSEVSRLIERRQAVERVSLANAITSLRLLTQVNWNEVFESVSRVDAILATDPAGIYSKMDFATRDSYRHELERIARGAKAGEMEVAGVAIRLSEASDDARRRHVGYFLIDDGRIILENEVACRVPAGTRICRWLHRHATVAYLGPIAIVTLVIASGLAASAAISGLGFVTCLILWLAALLAGSEVAAQAANYCVTRFLKPVMLPKMSFERGIPPECRTLVVVPMMLLTPESIREEVERLEIRYLANPDAELLFALAGDFSDAPHANMPEDDELLDVAIRGIAALNERYGQPRFFLFHRDRKWSETEQCWMGWERKRGKLEDVNAYLLGDRTSGHRNMLRVGDASVLGEIQFVITLDSDTQLPPTTARKMIEALAHPLNRPQVSADGSHVERGYTIIQPRVTTSLPSATSTIFSRIFADPAGTDPYTHVVSDVYQDLFGEGNYHGKGIYDLRAFQHVLSQAVPEKHLLSHDLLEGVFVRVGLASDIELLDLFPADYTAFANRLHRWVRGDWQIIDWLLPTVPSRNGMRPNPLSLINRWKIFDNLRRSLVPSAAVILLIAAWLAPSIRWECLALDSVIIFFPLLSQFVSRLTTRWKIDPMVWKEPATGALQALMQLTALLHLAAINTDAIVRVWYRRLVSKRLLLEWTTSAAAGRRARSGDAMFLVKLAWIPLVSICLTVFLSVRHHDAAPVALPVLALWFAFPFLHIWMNTPLRQAPHRRLSSADKRWLRRIARQTWRYFDELVGPQSNWLPPDNYQEFMRDEVARRTSPTNIGMWLTSVAAAHDLGYISLDDFLDRCWGTIETMDRLKQYEGHLLNWYNIDTLEPLKPEYVSAVDSGNFLACLWVLEQAIEDKLSAPLLGPEALIGLSDALALFKQSAEADAPGARAGGRPHEIIGLLLNEPAARLEHLIDRLGKINRSVADLRAHAGEACPAEGACVYWAGEIQKQAQSWNSAIDKYLGWARVLQETPPGSLLGLGPQAHSWRRDALNSAPSIRAISSATIPGLTEMLALRSHGNVENIAEPLRVWLDRLAESFGAAQAAAKDLLARADQAITRVRGLGDGINLRFLYDPHRRLFVTGYNVSDGRMDNSYFDLLASEARISSFVAVARGDVPTEHWWALGRPFGTAFGRRVLLSWSGTGFEYLMPLVFTKNFEASLLDSACSAAVECQIEYGNRRGVPWGISECGFSALDAHQIYQYKAFGVPGLGLRRGLEEDLVIAPYTTAIALAVNPTAAVANLRRLDGLSQMKTRGPFGFYEAIDYARHHGRHGERGVVVYSYMAHHQGMTLTSIANAVLDGILQRRFHSDPRVRATESLLYERVPVAPPLVTSYVRGAPPTRLPRVAEAPPTGRINNPDTPVPRAHLLSNGGYNVMITSAGGGYSRMADVDITRWRSDTTMDNWGSFCYIRDRETGAVWSATCQPLEGRPSDFSVAFSVDKATFRRKDFGIDTHTEIVVSPEDNVEIRRVTMTNRSLRARELELTSFAELAMLPHNDDRAHPAFAKLFIHTEAVMDHNALLAHRRPRSPKDPELWALHLVTCDTRPMTACQFETDRARFLGRCRSAADPVSLDQDLSNTVGWVLDPVFSLRQHIALPPGGRASVTFITGAANSRDDAVKLTAKYSDDHAISRAMDLAWTFAQLELRHLHFQAEDAQVFQQLAAHILYPNIHGRPPADRLRVNRLGQSRLWTYGISGDLPIVVLTIGDMEELDVLQELLVARTFWRTHGLKVDLVVFNEEEYAYDQPLQENIRRTVSGHSRLTSSDESSGVFVLQVEQLPDEDVSLIITVARMVLVGARGPLARQATHPSYGRLKPVETKKRLPVQDEPSPPLPFMELDFFNGMGGFTHDGKEYAIYLGKDSVTPMPWSNVMANPGFGALVTESGSGFSWCGNSQSNRLTPWSNDPISDPSGDVIYIRDEELNVHWSVTPLPIREDDPYRARHGQGYTVLEHNSHAIEQELTVFVPVNSAGGDPVLIKRLRLVNRGSRRRKLTVTSYTEWLLGSQREDTQQHVVCAWDQDSEAMFAVNPYHPVDSGKVAFSGSLPRPQSYTADRTEFIGRNRSASNPAGLENARLSNRSEAGFDPCAALRVAVELDPDEETVLLFVLGEAENSEDARAKLRKYLHRIRAEDALVSVKKWWDDVVGAVQVETPDAAANVLINRWLPYQCLSCRIWGRSAYYQSGGAFGFRDQLQDSLAMLFSAPQMTREQIVRCAAKQFVEGDVLHWWHQDSGAGVRTRISDDLLWLPFAVSHYVTVTGDRAILDESVPFIRGPELKPEEPEEYITPEAAGEEGTILEHCLRAIKKGSTLGPHGLPLIGSGDWNDGMNRVGDEGRGESVWLGWFLITVLQQFAELIEETEAGKADELRSQANTYALALEQTAWDGQWYLRGFFDDGSPLGSAGSEEAIIDSLPQSWAVISGAANPLRAAGAMQAVEEHLVRRDEGMILLFAPPFDKCPQDPGYIKSYPPGVRENGGQYTHGSLWVPMAFARMKHGDKAVDLLSMMNPIRHSCSPESTAKYLVDPYAVVADIYALEGCVGRGGWTWYTGSAAWMYRIWLEEILGIRIRGDKLCIDPVIHPAWDGFRVRLRFRSSDYMIEVRNPNHVSHGIDSAQLDGISVDSAAIPAAGDQRPHHIVVTMGRQMDEDDLVSRSREFEAPAVR